MYAPACRVEKVGTLTCFQGTVTRTSEVRPELYVGAFTCQQCQTVVRGIQQQFKYTEPLICTNPTCGNRCVCVCVVVVVVVCECARMCVCVHQPHLWRLVRAGRPQNVGMTAWGLRLCVRVCVCVTVCVRACVRMGGGGCLWLGELSVCRRPPVPPLAHSPHPPTHLHTSPLAGSPGC